MRKSVRTFAIACLALLTSAVLGVASAFMAALAVGATALIVPGTGTPNANIVDDYMAHAADRYLAPFVRDATDKPVCTSTNGCTLKGVDYPASFWPLGFIGNWCPGYKCDKWDVSVGTGVDHLNTDLHTALDTTSGDIIIFGYSQGGAVVSNELRNIGDLTPDQLSRLSVVMIGNAYNPDGGFFTRLGFLGHIPGLDVTFGQSTPVDTGLPMTGIGFQYDPVMYAPLYWGNPLSVLNAVAALETVHGYYLTPNGNGPTDPIAYGYTPDELADQLDRTKHPENFREDSEGNVYVMIPAKSLPLVDLVTSVVPAPLRPAVKPVADLVSPVMKVLIDLGYDWSGDPGKVRWLSPLPFNPIQNWPAVGVNLVAATLQGVQAFVKDLSGLGSAVVPAIKAPDTTTPVSTLAAADTTETTETTEKKQPKTTLTLVTGKESDTTAPQSANDAETGQAPTEDTPATKPDSTADEKGSVDTAEDKKPVEKKADVKKPDHKKAGTTTKPSHKKAAAEKSEAGKDADSDKAAA